jgi:hypothetical protein
MIRVFKPKKAVLSVNNARHITAQIDKKAIRTETLLGIEYTVVPVIAMIEGVRFGANQESPELGLAEEFGKNPIVWANKPLVLNHPQVDGIFVSANVPSVLEEWAFGVTMNPELDGEKLRLEAWIDNARVAALGGEFQDVVDAITDTSADAEIVEISVGFFSDIMPQKGRFKGQAFSGIWKNIMPDHLAILTDGVGACSVKDGCGVRTMAQAPKAPKLTADHNHQCGCGHPEACTCEEVTTQEGDLVLDDAEGTVTVNINVNDTRKKARSVPIVNQDTEVVDPPAEALEIHLPTRLQRAAHLIDVQEIDGGLLSCDAHKAIARALRKKFGYVYLYGYTSNSAIFEQYDDSGFAMYKIGINVSSEGAVTFVGEKKEVILLTKMVEQADVSGLMLNQDGTVSTKENDMPDPTVTTPPTATTPAPAVQTPATAPVVTPTVPEVTTQAAPAPKALSVQEYVDQAPPEIKEFLSGAVSAQNARKDSLIAVLKANKGNTFTDEWLKTQPLAVLEGMAKIAGSVVAPANYSGIAAPTVLEAAPTTQESQLAPPPPALFPIQGGKGQSDQAA